MPDPQPESPLGISRLLASIGRVMAVVSLANDEPRSLDPIAFDKLGVFVARMTATEEPSGCERLHCSLDLMPGWHGHGLAACGTDGEARYLLQLLSELENLGARYVNIDRDSNQEAVLVAGLPSFARPSFLAEDIDHLGACLQSLNADQIRAIGTHCTHELLLVDIGYEVRQATTAKMRDTPVGDALLFVNEAVRKAFTNRGFYASAYSDIDRHLTGDQRIRFRAAHDPPDKVWPPGGMGQVVDAVFQLVSLMEARVQVDGSTSRQLAAVLKTLGAPYARERTSRIETIQRVGLGESYEEIYKLGRHLQGRGRAGG